MRLIESDYCNWMDNAKTFCWHSNRLHYGLYIILYWLGGSKKPSHFISTKGRRPWSCIGVLCPLMLCMPPWYSFRSKKFLFCCVFKFCNPRRCLFCFLSLMCLFTSSLRSLSTSEANSWILEIPNDDAATAEEMMMMMMMVMMIVVANLTTMMDGGVDRGVE